MNELYDRQKEINLNIPEEITIIGCGGGGYWIGLLFALSGTKKFHLYDADIIESSNLNRLPLTKNDISVNKAIVLKEEILAIRPEISVVAHADYFTTISPMAGLIIDCTDVPKTQEMIKNRIRENGNKYLRIGCEENHITIHSDTMPDEWSNLEATGYERIPSWIGSTILTAVIGLIKVILSKEENIYIDINKIFDLCSKN